METVLRLSRSQRRALLYLQKYASGPCGVIHKSTAIVLLGAGLIEEFTPEGSARGRPHYRLTPKGRETIN